MGAHREGLSIPPCGARQGDSDGEFPPDSLFEIAYENGILDSDSWGRMFLPGRGGGNSRLRRSAIRKEVTDGP